LISLTGRLRSDGSRALAAPAPPGATITPPAAEVKRRANTKHADSQTRITATLTAPAG